MVKGNILIVDDEPTQCKVISNYIEELGYNHFSMNCGMDVIDFCMNKKIVDGFNFNEVDVILLDLSMPDLDGLTVLKQIEPIKGNIQVIVLTANKDIKLAMSAISYGAVDYIVKGDNDIFARITASISNAIDKKNLKYKISLQDRKEKDQLSFSDIVGQSDALLNSIKLAKKVINSNISVLLEGQNGTGKELLARAIHGSGIRAGKPFIVVECDALKNFNSDEELFGSEKYVSDGIIKSIGKIREANNGTIYFKRIDTLRYDLQIKLLRFMQDGEVLSTDGKSATKVNVRIICSTSRDIHRLVIAKKFREDLYYRLSTFTIKIPDLKERGEIDIKLLAESFCRDFSTNENKKIKAISNDALTLLYNHGWDDNIHQLKNSVFRAVVLCDGDTLKTEHFPQILNKENSSLIKAKSVIKKSSEVNSELIDIFDDEGRCKKFDLIEEEIIARLVEIYNGNLSEVAKQLDIGRSTIYRKLKINNE